MRHCVFVSHGWHDRWVAGQIAEGIRRVSGADVFIDIFDVKSGDRIEDKVRVGLTSCNELVCLLTPWSVGRNWVWAEMAGAWILQKRYVAITYGVTLDEIDKQHGGLAVLSPVNVIGINDLGTYFSELTARVKATQDV